MFLSNFSTILRWTACIISFTIFFSIISCAFKLSLPSLLLYLRLVIDISVNLSISISSLVPLTRYFRRFFSATATVAFNLFTLTSIDLATLLLFPYRPPCLFPFLDPPGAPLPRSSDDEHSEALIAQMPSSKLPWLWCIRTNLPSTF